MQTFGHLLCVSHVVNWFPWTTHHVYSRPICASNTSDSSRLSTGDGDGGPVQDQHAPSTQSAVVYRPNERLPRTLETTTTAVACPVDHRHQTSCKIVAP